MMISRRDFGGLKLIAAAFGECRKPGPSHRAWHQLPRQACGGGDSFGHDIRALRGYAQGCSCNAKADRPAGDDGLRRNDVVVWIVAHCELRLVDDTQGSGSAGEKFLGGFDHKFA